MTTMQSQSSISPSDLNRLLAEGCDVEMLDVRTPAEYAAERIPGARLVPIGDLDPAIFLKQRRSGDKPIYLLCQTGGRARRAIQMFRRAGCEDCVLVEGGMQAWIEAGLPVERGQTTGLPILRQVQITVGVVSAAGAGLALAASPWFALLPLVTGCGLLFAGLSGYCGLAVLLAKMPWNRSGGCGGKECCGEGKLKR